jgi:hypothetical protein
MALSPDASPSTSHGGSSPIILARGSGSGSGRDQEEEAFGAENEPPENEQDLGSPWESPFTSPSSSASRVMDRGGLLVAPPRRPSLIESSQNISPTSSVMNALSGLALRRGFFLLPVRTSNLRKSSFDPVYRAPHLDRAANGQLLHRRSSDDYDSPGSPDTPSSPFGQAWGDRRGSARSTDTRRWLSSTSCSPPDLKALRRRPPDGQRSNLGDAEAFEETRPGRPRLNSREQAIPDSPDSPGGFMARNAAQRRGGSDAPQNLFAEEGAATEPQAAATSEPDADRWHSPAGSNVPARTSGECSYSSSPQPHGSSSAQPQGAWVKEPEPMSPAKKRR